MSHRSPFPNGRGTDHRGSRPRVGSTQEEELIALVGAGMTQLDKLVDDLRTKQVDIDHIITTVRSALPTRLARTCPSSVANRYAPGRAALARWRRPRSAGNQREEVGPPPCRHRWHPVEPGCLAGRPRYDPGVAGSSSSRSKPPVVEKTTRAARDRGDRRLRRGVATVDVGPFGSSCRVG